MNERENGIIFFYFFLIKDKQDNIDMTNQLLNNKKPNSKLMEDKTNHQVILNTNMSKYEKK